VKDFNPFKSDIFSFRLVLLEIATLETPNINDDKEIWKINIKNSIKKFKNIYKGLMGELDELKRMGGLLKERLEIIEKRPDYSFIL